MSSQIAATEIEVGQLLGSGAFSNVREMKLKGSIEESDSRSTRSESISDFGMIDASSSHSNVSPNFITTGLISASSHPHYYSQLRGKGRVLMAYLSTRGETEIGDSSNTEDATKYAVKRLKNDLQGDTKISGAIDLAVEARFLSSLSHPHIVKFHGTGGEQGSADFFIIVDRVQIILSDVITIWRRHRERLKINCVCRNGAKLNRKERTIELQTDFDRRVDIARQIASALQYLHENS